jgi:hypothetical protein
MDYVHVESDNMMDTMKKLSKRRGLLAESAVASTEIAFVKPA